MKHKVDEENKTVIFEGDWPTVMGIPNFMKKNYPGYNHKIVKQEEYDKTQQS